MTKPAMIGDKIPQKKRNRPTTNKSIADKIRSALLAGEKLSSQECVKRFGGQRNRINAAAKILENQGYTILKENSDTGVLFYIDTFAKSFPSQIKVADTPEKIEPTPMPTLLEQLEVAAVAVDRKGRLGMTVRNSKHSWRVIIEGVATK